MGAGSSSQQLNVTVGYVVVNMYDIENCGYSTNRKLSVEDNSYTDDDALSSYDQDVGSSSGWLIGVCNLRGSMNGFTSNQGVISIVKLDFNKSDCRDYDNNLIPQSSNIIASYPTSCSLLSDAYFGADEDHMFGSYVIGNFYSLPLQNISYDDLFPWSKSNHASMTPSAAILNLVNEEADDDMVNTVVGYYMKTTSIDSNSCVNSFDYFQSNGDAQNEEYFYTYSWIREGFCHGNYWLMCKNDDNAIMLKTTFELPTSASNNVCSLDSVNELEVSYLSSSMCSSPADINAMISSVYIYCSNSTNATATPTDAPTLAPTEAPSATPSIESTSFPTLSPTTSPTVASLSLPVDAVQSYLFAYQYHSFAICESQSTNTLHTFERRMAVDQSLQPHYVNAIPVNICVTDNIYNSYYYHYTSTSAGVVVFKNRFNGSTVCNDHGTHVISSKTVYRLLGSMHACSKSALSVSSVIDGTAHSLSTDSYSFVTNTPDIHTPWKTNIRTDDDLVNPISLNIASGGLVADGVYQFTYELDAVFTCIQYLTDPGTQQDEYIYYGSELTWVPISNCVAGQRLYCDNYAGMHATSPEGITKYVMPLPDVKVEQFKAADCGKKSYDQVWWFDSHVCEHCDATVDNCPVSYNNQPAHNFGAVVCRDNAMETAIYSNYLAESNPMNQRHVFIKRIGAGMIILVLVIGVIAVLWKCYRRFRPRMQFVPDVQSQEVAYDSLSTFSTDDAVSSEDAFIQSCQPGDEKFYDEDDEEDQIELNTLSKLALTYDQQHSSKKMPLSSNV